MTRTIYIVLCVFGLTACASQIPLDDAYYRPENTVVPSKPSAPKTTANDVKQPQTNLEYISVQDTTITVRIKR